MEKVILIVAALMFVAGCGEFMAGVGTGAAVTHKVMEDGQDNFIAFVNDLNLKTAETIAAKKAIEDYKETLIKPETITAVESLKGREKDPTTWIALLSLLANGVWAGRTIEKKLVAK